MIRKIRTPVLTLPICLAFAFVFVLFFSLQILLPSQSEDNKEPLADPVSLSRLAAGLPLDTPPYEEHAEFHGELTSPPPLATFRTVQRVLGVTTAPYKRIEVDLTRQRVYAFEGTKKVYDFVVSTGLWGRTPTGEFTIWTKVRSQLMEGGNKAWGTYYYLPNVPYVMFFYNSEVAKMRGFSFHGTYWHHNFGHPMSHGCINMVTEDAKTLYEWATPQVTNPKAWSTLATADNPGTRVIIYGEAPTQ
jgi:hypothetical protein